MWLNSGYNAHAQVRYVVQWFQEWSEMQRSDFLPVLVQKFVPSGYVNGLVSGLDGMECHDRRPPSLFQCRVKLFREWSETWSQSERDQLLSELKAVDPTFVSKYLEEVRCVTSVGNSKVSNPQPELPEMDTLLNQKNDLVEGDV